MEFPQGESKVHFAENTSTNNNAIIVRQENEDTLSVHLGFLQLNHQYEISFDIKDSMNEDIYSNNQNVYAKIVSLSPTEDGEGHHIELIFTAQVEKLMKAEISLIDSINTKKVLNLVLNARVLGKSKGTPSLRDGIKCIGISAEDESEQSDWQGFD